MTTIAIRSEKPDDINAIAALTSAAFESVPYSEHNEALIINGLRDCGGLTFSLVAEQQGQLLGHIAVSAVSISDGSGGWYGIGPLSVLPQHQRQGIGSRLMRAALEQLAAIQARGCVLLGQPSYYQRFGFQAVAGLSLEGVPAEYFMAHALVGAYPQGKVTYHCAFNVAAA
ncbi:N-acetyltransferase [uncultured Ferrimonas sp.]|uniref:GNAT family N-acetyltransferase n=1 Tax=uncultured Ferrimonas sp. TaxID=432640 RepID=UPI0026232D3E|nr:N-acetyltransferase [uncultured Ferrimonas sp.]